jgi:hypothetical protein
MARLSYDRYGVHGVDIGGFDAPLMGRLDPERFIGVHVNALVTFPSDDPAGLEGLTEAEQERLARFQNFEQAMSGYMSIQGTRPQTLACGLADSPSGQLAWIVEKFKEWTDPKAALPEDAVGRDHLLTNISVYWFTNTAGSSANLYYETYYDPSLFAPKERGSVPTGWPSPGLRTLPYGGWPSATTTSSAGPSSIKVGVSPRWRTRTSLLTMSAHSSKDSAEDVPRSNRDQACATAAGHARFTLERLTN